MKFPNKSGSGRIFMNYQCHDVTWVPDRQCSYQTIVTLANGQNLEVTDYEERMDYHYYPADDGSEHHNVFILLDPSEADPTGIPSAADIKAGFREGLEPIIQGMMNETIHPDDVAFARIIFGNIEPQLRAFQKRGSLKAAQKDLAQRVFRI